MRSVETEEKLKQQSGDSHLIRYSESKGEYILSVSKRRANGHICQHFVVVDMANTYYVEGSDRPFYDADKLLDYFRRSPLSFEIDNIGKPCRATPVTGPEAPIVDSCVQYLIRMLQNFLMRR